MGKVDEKYFYETKGFPGRERERERLGTYKDFISPTLKTLNCSGATEKAL